MPYAVRRGRRPGVYDSWEECKAQVDRFPSARYKKFPSSHEARNFVESDDASSSSSSSYHPYGQRTEQQAVYTDGCCSRNGQHGARGGIGVYWGPNHSLNVSERLEGRQTNQRAEIEAASRALEQAREHNMRAINIHTDSKFTINGATKWVPSWKQNGWKTSAGHDVVNKQDFQKLDNLCQGMDVTWTYVPGHRGNGGNEMADQLARNGARK
ncbi:ribonuclease H1 [Spea bombifrons]|uniref:ribonuclease H1 n=1 Tax=Spea bombifrons TaxID=233779 RepID=UPI00234ACB76|nr:ribonuclease H1 [Spea bombifrons]